MGSYILYILSPAQVFRPPNQIWIKLIKRLGTWKHIKMHEIQKSFTSRNLFIPRKHPIILSHFRAVSAHGAALAYYKRGTLCRAWWAMVGSWIAGCKIVPRFTRVHATPFQACRISARCLPNEGCHQKHCISCRMLRLEPPWKNWSHNLVAGWWF